MNEQQKEFTIKEISHYNEEINDLHYKVNRSAFFTLCGVGLAVTIFVINNGEFVGNEIVDNLVGTASAASAVYNGIKAVQRICERTSLKHMVRTLEHDLTMSDLEAPKQLVKEKNM